MNEYPTVSFGDLLTSDGVRNGVYKGKEFHGRGQKIINMGELFAYPRLLDIPMKRVELDAGERERFLVQAGDLLFARRSLVAEGAGRCCLVKAVSEDTVFESSIIRARVNKELACSSYLFYLFSSSAGRQLLGTILRQTAVSGITGTDLVRLEVPLPSLSEQNEIAYILGTLDDKIELNRKTNETLEGMAKALFKSWFVDFDPVRAKAEGRPTRLPSEISDLFPDSFEESELGEIPKGWGRSYLDDLTSFVIGGDWGKECWSEIEQVKALCLRGADIPSLQAFSMGKPPTRFLKDSSFKKRTLVDGDIVLEISGGSPDQSTGRPVLISSELIERAEAPLVCSNFCRLIRFSDVRWSPYVYYLLLSLYQSGEMFQYETGTTGIKNFGYKYFASSRCFPKPANALLDAFYEQIKSFHASCHQHGKESNLLSKARDALLPKLISGELRIPDAARMIEEVGV